MVPTPLSNPKRKAYRVLSELLSGPDLIYDEFAKGFILRHLVDLVSVGPELQYKIDNVASVNLLQAYGSIPFEYPHNRYSVPVIICFPQYYPHLCPKVCVNPPDDTIINNGTCVDSSGAVSHTYLNAWKFCESNVVSLVQELSKAFTVKPPLGVPDLCRVLSPDQTKLAKLLIENGGQQLFSSLQSLEKRHQEQIFTEITGKYLRHLDLVTYIKSKEGGLEEFIENVKNIAQRYVTVAPFIPTGTHGSHQADQIKSFVPPEANLHPEAEKRIDSLLISNSFGEAAKTVIKEHIRDLEGHYNYIVCANSDLSKPSIEVVVEVPYCYRGCSNMYKVSVTICLPISYPANRPHVFLKCPKNMIIKGNLLSVHPSCGLVFFTYLREWNKAKSNLVGLVSHLSAEFTCEHPLIPAHPSDTTRGHCS